MPLKKSDLYSSLWASCDELRGGMDASQYKDYVLVLLFVKYISDKFVGQPFAEVEVPEGSSFADMVALKGKSTIGDDINKRILAPIAQANDLSTSSMPDFNDPDKLGSGKDMVERLTNLIAIFEKPELNFSAHRADDDDLLGDAYEYLMRHFATESGKSKGQFYTPSEVSRIMAQLLGIRHAETTGSTTVYDPTCGSGSLLLKVGSEAAHDKSDLRVTLYGQEKDSSTSVLARMNMILHDFSGADIVQGNTLSAPHFKDNGQLQTFDYVVANPPFSDKRWTTGLSPESDEFDRFDGFGIPPAKQGDYAYLLHILRSLKSTGRGVCVLPHGVLFRGNTEAAIRRNLIDRGYIQAIIGLPANLFYGTGIPACLIVLDKKDAAARQAIFMVDASKGFRKDGPKNRLREQDIHRIVDVFGERSDIPGYSRLVPVSEIADGKNDYNLNLPRYIDTRAAEDIQDIEAHLHGGIPVRDLDALQPYWDVLPTLRSALFEEIPKRPAYRQLTPEYQLSTLHSQLSTHSEFAQLQTSLLDRFQQWEKAERPTLEGFDTGAAPKPFIETLAESLLHAFEPAPLIDEYALYQHLMDFWADTMQDDAYLIAAGGWVAEPQRILVKDKKGNLKDKGWTCDLVPPALVIARYFAGEKAALTALESEFDTTTARLSELEEEHGSEEGALNDVSGKSEAEAAWTDSLVALWQEETSADGEDITSENFRSYTSAMERVESTTAELAALSDHPAFDPCRNKNGSIGAAKVKKAFSQADGEDLATFQNFLALESDRKASEKQAKTLLASHEENVRLWMADDPEEEKLADLCIIADYLAALASQTTLKSQIKIAAESLDQQAHDHYAQLSEAEIKTLVIGDKWLAHLEGSLRSEIDRVTQTLTRRIKDLAERYEKPLPQLESTVEDLEQKVQGHLTTMGFTL